MITEFNYILSLFLIPAVYVFRYRIILSFQASLFVVSIYMQHNIYYLRLSTRIKLKYHLELIWHSVF